MPAWGVFGIEELRRKLEDAGREARDWAPAKAASMLAEYARRAFREPGLRPAPWPPLAASTLGRAGAASKGATDARKKAAEFRRKAYEQDYATVWLEGKAKKKAAKAAEAAAKKAREWRGKAKAAKAAGAGRRQPLIDTGRLWQSVTSQGARVTSDAPYAVYHQFGSIDGRHPPARPFVPVREDGTALEKVGRYIAAALEQELRRRLGK